MSVHIRNILERKMDLTSSRFYLERLYMNIFLRMPVRNMNEADNEIYYRPSDHVFFANLIMCLMARKMDLTLLHF